MAEEKKEIGMTELSELIDKHVATGIEKAVGAVKAEFAEHQNEVEAKYQAVHKLENDVEGDKRKGLTPAVRFGRFVKALAAGRGDRGVTVEFARKMYEGDEMSIGFVEKAMGATVPSDGGYFVPNVLSSEVIPYLYNKIIMRQAGARVVPMPNGNMTIPRFDATATGYWVGENTAITKSQSTIGSIKLNAKKAAGLVPAETVIVAFVAPSTTVTLALPLLAT